SLARERDEPAHGERGATLGTYLHGHLVRSTTDAAALHLDHRLEVGERGLEDVHARLIGAAFDEIHRAIEDALGRGLLALQHHGVDEFGAGRAVVGRVGENRTFAGRFAAALFFAPPLGFFVPYLERL